MIEIFLFFQFIAIVALFAIALAEDLKTSESYPVAAYHAAPAVATYHASPAVAASSAGHAYGAHGARDAGYGAYGASNYGDSGLYADRAHAAQAHHNIGGYGAHDAYGANAASFGKYRNVGTYAQDKVIVKLN